jgi:hypothetical protein
MSIACRCWSLDELTIALFARKAQCPRPVRFLPEKRQRDMKMS